MNEVFLILLGAAILFASNRVRPDVVAFLTVLALMLTGVLTPREALAGFGDPVIIVIAGLLVVGEALTRTGVAQAISRWIMRFAGSNETRILILLMTSAGLLGAVMSSTAVVAIFIPVALAIGRKSGVAPSRLLIPLSYASLISGMLTLIATTPNLVASSELDKAGFETFNFFDFTPIGLTVLVLGIAYIVLFGRRFLPGQERTPVETVRQGMRELLADFDIPGQADRLRISPLSPLVGRTLVDSEIGTRYDAWIVLLEREERLGRVTKASPSGDLTLRAGDVLVVGGAPESIDQLVNETELERLPLEDRHRRRWLRDVGLAIVLVHPESRMLGKSLKKGRFRSRYSLNVLAIRRKGKLLDSFLDK
jgi:di/tricarboxylate transporter